MDLFLCREYHPRGCNGSLHYEGGHICHSLELPWRDNRRNVSCIPEGIYPLGYRYSKRWGWHIEIEAVADRSFILFHPANNALKELRGCIAPVSSFSGIGMGCRSRAATEKLEDLVFPELYAGNTVRLFISGEPMLLPKPVKADGALPVSGRC